MRMFLKLSAAAVALAVASQASAAVIYTNPLLSGPTATGTSVGFSATSPSAGPATFSFNLNGFVTIDGINAYEDDFSLLLNGAPILTLSYNLGGGGTNAIFTNTAGAVVSYATPASLFNGGSLLVSFANLALVAGTNTFSFAYASPTGAALGGSGPHAGPQSIGDEAWGISNVLLSTITSISAVPEPTTWAMVLTGFGAAGVSLRARRKRSVLRLV